MYLAGDKLHLLFGGCSWTPPGPRVTTGRQLPCMACSSTQQRQQLCSKHWASHHQALPRCAVKPAAAAALWHSNHASVQVGSCRLPHVVRLQSCALVVQCHYRSNHYSPATDCLLPSSRLTSCQPSCQQLHQLLASSSSMRPHRGASWPHMQPGQTTGPGR